MRKQDVPQDAGRMNDGVREISYAVDEDGRYVLVPSAGWEAKAVVNDQAWEIIEEEVTRQIRLVREGQRSPLAVFMARNLMEEGLLASYMGIARWRVRRHLRPDIFARLKPAFLERYAALFGVTVQELTHPELPSEKDEGTRNS